MDSFDLLKFKNSLLNEDYKDQGFESDDEMQDYYNDTDFIDEDSNRFYAPTYLVQKYGAEKAKEIEANIEDEGDNTWDLFTSLETPKEVDDFIGGFISENELKLKTAKPTNATNSFNFAKSDDAGEGGAMEEGQLEEMASFYKLTDNSPEAIAAIQAKKERFKPGSAIYNTLDTLEKNGEIDYKALSKETGKDIATYNNPKSREVLEKDLAAFVSAGASPLAVKTGRPADPNKAAAAPKSPKLKITNPKAPKAEKPASTKLADLAPSSVFGGGADEEEMDMEKQATKAAKGNKRLGTAAEKLAQVTQEMKALIPAYQAAKGTPEEAAIVAQLKDLTAEKKSLEAKVYKAPKALSAADLMGGEEA